jgi:hypothetical protein
MKTDVPFRIGAREDSDPFRGLVDNVRVYDRTLSPAEVAAIYDAEEAFGVVAQPSAELAKGLQAGRSRRTRQDATGRNRTLSGGSNNASKH